MGFTSKLIRQLSDPDKLKNLADKAQKAVSENQEQLQGAIGKAGAAVSEKTGGKYDEKIAKLSDAATGAIDKVTTAGGADAAEAGKPPAATNPQSAATPPAPTNPQSAATPPAATKPPAAMKPPTAAMPPAATKPPADAAEAVPVDDAKAAREPDKAAKPTDSSAAEAAEPDSAGAEKPSLETE